MAKTKFVRVATSGPTIDGRNIDPAALEQMAASYDPVTYGARINLEHFRGVTGQPPFQMGGDVIALKTEQVELNVAGKTEKRTALLAEMDVNDAFVALNKQDQKVFSSIEIVPDFAGTGKAYLGGLAFTDSPASLGTERLQFTAHAKAFGNLISAPQELNLEYNEASQAQDDATKLRAGLTDFFKNLFAAPAAQAPAVTPAAPAAPAVVLPANGPDFTAFAKSITDGFTKLSELIEANQKAGQAQVDALTKDFTTLKTQLETTESTSYTARPTNSGAKTSQLADY